MVQQVVDLECPDCGAPVNTQHTSCPYCHHQVIVSSFTSVADMPIADINKHASVYRKALSAHPEDSTLNNSVGMCYLKLKLYDKALSSFEKAIEDSFDNSETYFYAAVCLLGGKKAFLAPRGTIDKIEEYLNAALLIEPRAIYLYFQAYMKFDYFHRKGFKTSPTYQEALASATDAGISSFDIDQLYGILAVPRPEVL